MLLLPSGMFCRLWWPKVLGDSENIKSNDTNFLREGKSFCKERCTKHLIFLRAGTTACLTDPKALRTDPILKIVISILLLGFFREVLLEDLQRF